jgi:hypothetical protein
MSAPLRYKISLTVTVAAPFLVQGSEPGAFGLDAVVLRDIDRCPIIPGTLLIGKLRQAWTEFGEEEALIKPWLGSKGMNFMPSLGRLCDADLRWQAWVGRQSEDLYPPYPRVAIDEARKSAVTGALQHIEQPWKNGEELTFGGDWHTVATPDEIPQLVKAIEAGLTWSGQLGGEASIGFGQIKQVTVSADVCIDEMRANLIDKSAKRLYFRLTSNAPLMLPKHGSGAENLFESTDEIPGNAIKAAFALTYGGLQAGQFGKTLDVNSSDPLESVFEKIVFSHALPGSAAEGTKRASALPASIVKASVKAGTSSFFDVHGFAEPHLIGSVEAPAFAIDWKEKDFNAFSEQFPRNWIAPNRSLRVRTAIEAGMAKESDLFGYEMAHQAKGGAWLGWIDLCNVPNEKVESVCGKILEFCKQPLLDLGKTKAAFSLEFSAKPIPQTWAVSNSLPAIALGQKIVSVLNTSALLTSLDKLCDGSSLRTEYENYWTDVSGGSLKLSHFFASQYLAGGEFTFQHRQKRNNRPYRPWLVTREGSVFILEVTENAALATEKLSAWQRGNLPLSQTVKACYGESWQENPYQPENGFGEILIDPQHNIPAPLDSEITKIEVIL